MFGFVYTDETKPCTGFCLYLNEMKPYIGFGFVERNKMKPFVGFGFVSLHLMQSSIHWVGGR